MDDSIKQNGDSPQDASLQQNSLTQTAQQTEHNMILAYLKRLTSGRINRSTYITGLILNSTLPAIFFLPLYSYSPHDVLIITIGAILGTIMNFWLLSLMTKRFHDIDLEGPGILLLFIPVVGTIWYYKLILKEGNLQANSHGQSPGRGINMNEIFSFSLSKFEILIALAIVFAPALGFYAIKGSVPLPSISLSSLIPIPPSPTPTSVPQITAIDASWKTYVDEKGKYSFNYPPEQTVHENQMNMLGSHVEWPGSIELLPLGITIKFQKFPANQTLEQYLLANVQCTDMLPSKGKPIVLSGQSGLIFENTECSAMAKTQIDVVNNGILYTIEITDYNADARGIISTFKFTN